MFQHCPLPSHYKRLQVLSLIVIYFTYFTLKSLNFIFSEIDSNKIQSRSPSGHLLFNFPLLLKYKTDFSSHCNLPETFHSYDQCEASSPCFFSGFPRVSRTVQGTGTRMLHGCGLVRHMAIRRLFRVPLDRTRNIVSEHRAKNQTAVFQSCIR